MRETGRISKAMAWPYRVILLGATRATVCAYGCVCLSHIYKRAHIWHIKFRGCSASFVPLSTDWLYARISFARKRAHGGERFCLLTNNLRDAWKRYEESECALRFSEMGYKVPRGCMKQRSSGTWIVILRYMLHDITLLLLVHNFKILTQIYNSNEYLENKFILIKYV